jgi:F0F1-type ATP synthase assembly protein I
MNGSIDTPSHVKLAQEKAEWDAKQKAKQKAQAENTKYVIVTEIDIPFSKLVGFLVKLAIAAVPAGIIVFIFWSMLAGLLVNLMR